MTKKLFILVALTALVLPGCRKAPEKQHDLLLETAAGLTEVLDTPLNHGRTLYGKYCSVCHGVQGQGDGFNAYNLDPSPRNFTDSSFVAQMDTASIIEAITSGGKAIGLSSNMPPWGRSLDKEKVRFLALYIMHLAHAGSKK